MAARNQIMALLVITPLFLAVASASIHLNSPKEVIYSDIYQISQSHGEPNILESEKLGDVAPGQTVYFVIERKSSTTFLWDNANIQIPDGWKKTGEVEPDAFLYDVAVPQNTKEGDYTITITTSGDLQVLTPNVIDLTVHVEEDAYFLAVDDFYSVYMDAFNLVPFTIKSDSIAQDPVSLSIEGIPANWVEKKEITISAGEEKRIFFLVDPKTEGVYPIKFKAITSQGGIGGTADSQITVYPASLSSKLKALGEGFSIVTPILQPFYSLLAIIGSLF